MDPWSMMSEVWEGKKIAKELSKGRYITGRRSLRGRFTCIDKAAVSVC